MKSKQIGIEAISIEAGKLIPNIIEMQTSSYGEPTTFSPDKEAVEIILDDEISVDLFYTGSAYEISDIDAVVEVDIYMSGFKVELRKEIVDKFLLEVKNRTIFTY